MQVFKLFLKVCRKHITSICIYVGLYAVLLSLVSTSMQKTMNDNFSMYAVDIAVIDRDHSAAGEALTAYLDSMHNLVELEDDPVTIQDYTYYRFVRYILIIPEGFEEKLLAGETENLLENVRIPGSVRGVFLDNQVNTFVKQMQLYLAGGFELSEAADEVLTTLAQENEVEVLQFEGKASSTNPAVFYFFQYLPYIYILVVVCGLAPILLIVNKKQVMDRTICSSLTLWQRNFQMALGSGVYSICVYLVFFVLGILMFRKDFFCPKLGYLMVNSAIFLLFALAMTYFICTSVTLGDSALNLVANTVGLSMCFICGVFVPQSMLSADVLKAARFLPAYWYIKNNNMIGGLSEEAFSIESFWTSAGIQMLFVVVMFSAALVASRVKQQKV